MNTYVVFGIFGMISNFVAALADVPLVRPGKAGANVDRRSGSLAWWNHSCGNRDYHRSTCSFKVVPASESDCSFNYCNDTEKVQSTGDRGTGNRIYADVPSAHYCRDIVATLFY